MNSKGIGVLLVFFCYSLVTLAQMSGTGMKDDPYQIRTVYDLFDMRVDLSAHYKLMNDLDLAEWIEEENPVNGWNPPSTFTGTFDGNNKTISGLYINRIGSNNIGLFSTINNATVKNLTLESPNIQGSVRVGSLAGQASNSAIENVTVNNPIISASAAAGGLFGSFDGTLTNVVISSPFVQCSTDKAGGLIGILSSSISNIVIKEPHVEGAKYVGGLVGETSEDVTNVIVWNPKIIATGNYVGGITGYWNAEATGRNKFHTNNYVIGGVVEGKERVGGIIGYAYRSVNQVTSQNYEYSLIKNYSSASVCGTLYVGGICGYIKSSQYKKKSENAGHNMYERAHLLKNRNDGFVNGVDYVGGICGEIETEKDQSGNSYVYLTGSFNQNVVTNNVSGNTFVNGVFGYFSIGSEVTTSLNLCVSETISASSGTPTRIGCSGSNYALLTTALIVGGEKTEVEDGGNNGIGYGLYTLKRKNTYLGFGYDFENDWNIVEGETFPFNIDQSIPATISSCVSGSNGTISGTATDDGIVYVFVGDNMKEGTIINGSWTVSLGDLEEGTIVKVSVQTGNKKPSIIVSTIAQMPEDNRIHFDETATSLPIYIAGEKGDVTMKRTIKANEWSTIVLPFTLTKAKAEAAFGSDVQLAEFSGFVVDYGDDDENVVPLGISINFNTYTLGAKKPLTGGKPFLIKTSQDITSIEADDCTLVATVTDMEKSDEFNTPGKFTGTFVKTKVPEDGLFISENKFWYSTGATNIKAFRGWFELGAVLNKETDFSAKIGFTINDEPTHIEGFSRVQSDDNGWYTLEGMKFVKKPTKPGLYLHGGKKVVVK